LSKYTILNKITIRLIVFHFINYGSVAGTILLVVGLYSVLWGKSKDGVKGENLEAEQTKEETRLECLVQH